MFTRRHERDLAEIRALHQDLAQRVAEALKQIKHIQKAHGIKWSPTLVAQHQRQSSSVVEGQGAGPVLAFVHIPKTAGATVTSMLAGGYSETAVRPVGNYLRYPEETVRKLASRSEELGAGERVLVGHLPYGLFRAHLPPDTRYMTFLREPVDRVISHYYRHIHIHRVSGRKRWLDRSQKIETVKAHSLEEALVELRFPDLNNLATRFLCGSPSPKGDLPPSALTAAKANLREFAFVGIQERFEEAVVLLHRMLGLELVASPDYHVNFDRPAVEEIPAEQRALIEEHNALDAELYGFGQELFESAVADADETFAAEVETLRAMSEAANEEHRLGLQAACDWLDRELPAGTTKTQAQLHEAAEAAGISELLLKHALRLLPVMNQLHDGQVLLTRTHESRVRQA